MGLPWQSLALLIREHKADPFQGPVLILGRQSLNITSDQLVQLLREGGVTPARLAPGENTKTNIPSLAGTPAESCASDTLFFKLLGIDEVVALDYSPYEGAEIIADLNQAVDEELDNRFGLILDAGTIEHVFDIRRGLINIVSMLKPGGKVIHMTPANNYVNHGFYQVSPTLFYDYYGANGFADMRAEIILHGREDYLTSPWFTIAYDPNVHGGLNSLFCNHDTQLVTMFAAVKTAASTSEAAPLQNYFEKLHAQGPDMHWQELLLSYSPQGASARMVEVSSTPQVVRTALPS
jgi:SAM-dependent methyltransferase